MKATVSVVILNAGSNGEAAKDIARVRKVAMAVMDPRVVIMDPRVAMVARGAAMKLMVRVLNGEEVTARKARVAVCREVMNHKAAMAARDVACRVAMEHKAISVEAMAVMMKEARNGVVVMAHQAIMVLKEAMAVELGDMKVMDAARVLNGAKVTARRARDVACREATDRKAVTAVSAEAMKATVKEVLSGGAVCKEDMVQRVAMVEAVMVHSTVAEAPEWRAITVAPSVADTKDTVKDKALSMEDIVRKEAITGTRMNSEAVTRGATRTVMKITDPMTGIFRVTGTAEEAGGRIIIIRGRMIFSLFY